MHVQLTACLLVVSSITPIDLFLLPALIAGPSDDGTINIRSNVSFCPSNSISSITGTLTLLFVIPLSNVAVSIVVSKSTPPVSQTLFSKHIIAYTLHYYLQQTLVTVLME